MSYKQKLSFAVACLISLNAVAVGGVVACSNQMKPVCLSTSSSPTCPIHEDVCSPGGVIGGNPQPIPTLSGCASGHKPACAELSPGELSAICKPDTVGVQTTGAATPAAAAPAPTTTATPAVSGCARQPNQRCASGGKPRCIHGQLSCPNSAHK